MIGVNSSHFVGEPFNYAVPAERIKELMDSAGVDNVVSETTQTYREGIRAYFDGDRETAVSSLEKVLDEQPANGLAETYLGKAKELPAPPAEEKDSGTFSAGWIALAGGVVVAIVGGLTALILLVRRARNRKPAAGQQAITTAGIPTGSGPGPAAVRRRRLAQPAYAPVPAGFAPAPAPAPAPQPQGSGGGRRGEVPGHHGVLHHLRRRAWTPAPTSAAPAAPGTSRAPDRPTPPHRRHRPGPRTGAVSPYPASDPSSGYSTPEAGHH